MKKQTSRLWRILTNSERATFACRRKWAFRYLDGLSAGDTAAPLRMGSLWHLVLAAYYRSGMTLTVEGADSGIIQPWLEQQVSRLPSIPDPERRDEVAAEDREHAELCRAMFRGYLDAWQELDRANWAVEAVEVQGAREFRHPTTGKPLVDRVRLGERCRNRTWAYGGSLDLLVRNKLDGTFWLVEHKTTSESAIDQYLRKLNWDPQIRGYAWLAGQPAECSDAVLRDLGPIRISGVIYNVARKKVPGVPALLKDGKSLSRAKIDTTRDEYLLAVINHGFDPGDYTDMLESLKGRVFFGREAYPFTDPEIEQFGMDAAHAALEVMAETKKPYHSRQVAVCTGPMASCQYQSSICLEDGPMARRAYTTMGIRHVELHGDMAEPWAAQERGLTLRNSSPPADQIRTFTSPEVEDMSPDPFTGL